MTWVLVLVLIRADGAVWTERLPGWTEPECQRIGSAWVASVYRADIPAVPVFRCDLSKSIRDARNSPGMDSPYRPEKY